MDPKRPAELTNTSSAQFIWPSLLPRDGQTSVNNTPFRWRFGSRIVVPAVGLFSKFWMTVANTSMVHHADVLHNALQDNYEAWQQQQRAHYRSSSSCLANVRQDQNNNQSISSSLATVNAANERKSSVTTTSQGCRPLITYSNHSSCLDDPMMWGALLPFRWQFNSDRHRWSAAAAEICFAGRWHSIFFSLGKTFPIIRGEGIYQPAMDYAANLMRSGVWMHFFPEGKVIPRLEKADPTLLKFRYDENGKPITNEPKTNGETSSFAAMIMKKRSNTNEPSLCDRLVSLVEQQSYSLKWGMARLIIEHVLGEGSLHDDDYNEIRPPTESSSYINEVGIDPFQPQHVLPEVDVLPIYHFGMDDVLPTRHPYIPRIFNRVTFFVRPEGPIRIDRNFLLKLFDVDDDSASQIKSNGPTIPRKLEMSLTEKRIRLMRFLEDELNELSSKAQWLHEKWNITKHDQQ